MKPVSRHRWLRCAVLVMLGATDMLVSAERLPMQKGNENFGAEALTRGVFATELECSSVSGAVWARTDATEAEYLCYWASGMADRPTNPRALIYVPGDQLAFDQPAPRYTSLNPAKMQSLVDEMEPKVGVPLILVARPVTFGSSCEHRKRWRRLEPQLVSNALDELKTRHGIQELTLVGLSGGGHIVASLLGWRSDITCSAPTSSVSSPRQRWADMGRTMDLTGYADFYELLQHLRREVMNPKLRVFVLGDPKDSSVKWPTQLPIAARLKDVGFGVEVVTGEGGDTQRHALGLQVG